MKKVLSFILLSLFALTGCAAHRNILAPVAYQDEIEEASKLIDRGSSLQAIDDLTVLIQINPKDTQALFLRGVAYQSLERFDKAVEDFEGVLKVDSKNEKSHYNLGMIYAYKLNESKLALKHFNRFLDINPQHKNAFAVAKIMSTIDGPDRLFLSPGAQTETILDQARKAPSINERRQILEKSMKENPNSPIFPFFLGQTYDYKDRPAGEDAKMAKGYYEKALTIRPTCAPCQRALGTLLVRMGKVTEGQLHLKKARLFDPSTSVQQAKK